VFVPVIAYMFIHKKHAVDERAIDLTHAIYLTRAVDLTHAIDLTRAIYFIRAINLTRDI